MKRQALKGFTAMLGLAAVAATALLPARGLLDRPAALLLLLLLAAGAGTRSVRISKLRIHVTASDLFIFYALVAVAPIGAPLVALAAVIGAQLSPQARTTPMRTVFNLALVPLSAAVASWTFLALGGPAAGGLDAVGVPLLVAAGAFFATNLALVTVAIRLETGRGIASILASFGPFTAVSCLSSCLTGAGLLMAVWGLGPIALVLGLFATAPLVTYFRAHRQEAEKARTVAVAAAAVSGDALPR